ncbi:phospholipase A2-like [Stegostoma tigrinum]|uniref:phospholipase A2-like n=1 Tax=Stegostoma tigrinum TaxID=3053191 RepID=UPI00202B98EF|nr:phospholipase A2-like [Stegostoma tigrinum]
MIKCAVPNSRPVFDYSDYGCYCGFGGTGSPVDELDRCCQIHDNCYGTASKIKECRPIYDNPYFKLYKYSCSSSTITCGPVASANISPRAIWQFRKMIKCVIPDSSPILDYNNYGCNCGFGGSGKYVDELDKCCLNHDICYRKTKAEHCKGYMNNPYIELYSYSCSGKEITCSSKNNPCESDICDCDRTAAICFSQSDYNPDHKNLDKELYC